MPPVDEAKEEADRHWQAVAARGAVDRGDFERVELELKGENEKFPTPFNPTYKMTDGAEWTVLMLAANSGKVGDEEDNCQLIEKFTKGGRNPKIDEKDANGFQAISLAALKGHHDITKALLEKKSDVNARDGDGETPLMKAAAQGHTKVVQLLLDNGADPDALDTNEMSAIKKAASWGHVETLKTLLPRVENNPRQLKHCLLFGRMNCHEGIIEAMTRILEPEPVVVEAPKLDDLDGAVEAAA